MLCYITKNLDKLESLNQEFFDLINGLCEKYGDIFGVSLGYAFYDKTETDINSTIKKADTMMYENKRKKAVL